MTRELETTGPPFRGAPVAPVLVPPTPSITVRDQDGELLLEVRSSMRGFRLAYNLAYSVGIGGLLIAFSSGTIWIPLLGAGIAAAMALVAIRQSTITTTFRLRARELIIEESGLMHRSVQRIPLADLEAPLVHSRDIEDGPEYSLLLPRSGTAGHQAIRVLRGHERKHLEWPATALTKRMLAPATRTCRKCGRESPSARLWRLS